MSKKYRGGRVITGFGRLHLCRKWYWWFKLKVFVDGESDSESKEQNKKYIKKNWLLHEIPILSLAMNMLNIDNNIIVNMNDKFRK